jgi:hypothetical protein
VSTRVIYSSINDGSTAAMAVTAVLKLRREPGCVDIEQAIRLAGFGRHESQSLDLLDLFHRNYVFVAPNHIQS